LLGAEKMHCLEQNLGKRLSTKEVAEFLKLDTETVRRHYEDLGGIRLGSRILFFENLIVEEIRRKSHAVQEKEEEQNRVDSRGDASRQEILQGLQNQERGFIMGSGNKGKTHGRVRDPFKLLDSA